MHSTPVVAPTERVGLFAAVGMALITTVTFGFALTAIPIAGANCPGDCIEYPYLETADRFPRDYLWMYPAMVMMVGFVVLIVSLRGAAPSSRKTMGDVAVILAAIAAAILVPTYFVQVSVVPASIAAGETEGIALITQYNPHGLFIALEEIGYLMMDLSLAATIPLITDRGAKARVVRWLFGAAFVLPVLALAVISVNYGLDRQDRFEVVVISVVWLVLIVGSVLLALIFRDRIRSVPDDRRAQPRGG